MKKLVTIKTKDVTYQSIMEYEKSLFENFFDCPVFERGVIKPEDIIMIEIEDSPNTELTY